MNRQLPGYEEPETPSTRMSLAEVNALVAAYFDESGLSHSAFTLRQESRLDAVRLDGGVALSSVPIPPGQLVRVLMKGLFYLEAEARWRGEDVTENPPRLIGYALPNGSPFRPLPPEPPSGASPPPQSPVESGTRSPADYRAGSTTKTPRESPPLDDGDAMQTEPIASTSKVQLDAPIQINGLHPEPRQSPEVMSRSSSVASAAKRKERGSLEPVDAMDVDTKAVHRSVSEGSGQRDGKRPRIDMKLELPEAALGKYADRVDTASPADTQEGTPPVLPNSTSGEKRSPSSAISNSTAGYFPAPTAPEKMLGSQARPSSSKGTDESRRGSLLGASPTLTSTAGPLGNSRGRQPGIPTVSISVKTVTTTTTVSQPAVAAPVKPPATTSMSAPAAQQRRSVSPITMRRIRSRSPSGPKSALPPETKPIILKSRSAKSADKSRDAAFNHKAVSNGNDHDETPRGPDPEIFIDESSVVRFSGAPPKYCSSPCAFNNELLATGSNDSQMRIYEVPTKGGGPQVEEHANGKHAAGAKKIEIPCAAWNSHGTLLATGSEDGVVRCWTVSGELSGVLTMHQGSVWTLKWHSDGTRLLTGSHDYSVILWDAGTTHMKQNWTTHTDRVMCVDWIDEQTWASCSRDGQVHICSIGRNAPISRLRGHTDDVNFIRVDPSRTLLATCSSDETVRIWSMIGLAGSRANDAAVDDETTDLPELERKGGSVVLRGHTNEVHQIAWQPGSGSGGRPRVLASVSSDLTGRVWDVDQGTCIFRLDRHVHEVYSLCFQPTRGDILALGSNDGRVSFWSMKDGREIAEYLHSAHNDDGDDRRVYEVVWHPKRNQVAVTGTGTAVIFPPELQA